MIRGLWVYSIAALVCLSASLPGLPAQAAYGVLIVGRLLLGLSESLTMVGLLSWGFGIMGPQASGRVIALVGMGMYGAFAVGGPVGLALFNQTGFAGVMGASALVPLIGLAMALPVAGVAPLVGERPSFWTIIGRILGARPRCGPSGRRLRGDRRVHAAAVPAPRLAPCRARTDLLRQRVRVDAHPVRPPARPGRRHSGGPCLVGLSAVDREWPRRRACGGLPERAWLFPDLPGDGRRSGPAHPAALARHCDRRLRRVSRTSPMASPARRQDCWPTVSDMASCSSSAEWPRPSGSRWS